MPKQITKTVYTFNELLELGDTKAIDNAREWLREVNVSHEWWESLYETWTDALKQIGFNNVEIAFRGFWSQGDGASFTATVDMEKLIDFMGTELPANETITYDGQTEDFRGWIVHKCKGVASNPKFLKLKRVLDILHMEVVRSNSHYVHENTCNVSREMNNKRDSGALASLWDDFAGAVRDLRKDLCRAIYRDLEAEYEYLCSDESLKDLAEANEYTFTASGKREG